MKDRTRVCMFCGSTFTATKELKKYCCIECQTLGIERRERQYNYDRHKRDYELAHPGEVYNPRPRKGNPGKTKTPQAPKKTFADKLLELKAEGKDYIEEQRKDTIERYARVVI